MSTAKSAVRKGEDSRGQVADLVPLLPGPVAGGRWFAAPGGRSTDGKRGIGWKRSLHRHRLTPTGFTFLLTGGNGFAREEPVDLLSWA